MSQEALVTPSPVDDAETRAFISGWNAKLAGEQDFDMALHWWKREQMGLLDAAPALPQPQDATEQAGLVDAAISAHGDLVETFAQIARECPACGGRISTGALQLMANYAVERVRQALSRPHNVTELELENARLLTEADDHAQAAAEWRAKWGEAQTAKDELLDALEEGVSIVERVQISSFVDAVGGSWEQARDSLTNFIRQARAVIDRWKERGDG